MLLNANIVNACPVCGTTIPVNDRVEVSLISWDCSVYAHSHCAKRHGPTIMGRIHKSALKYLVAYYDKSEKETSIAVERRIQLAKTEISKIGKGHKKRVNMAQNQGGLCAITGNPLDLGDNKTDLSPSIEHIIPRALGGEDAGNTVITGSLINKERNISAMDIHPSVLPFVKSTLSKETLHYLSLSKRRRNRASSRFTLRKLDMVYGCNYKIFTVLQKLGANRQDANLMLVQAELSKNIFIEIAKISKILLRSYLNKALS